MVYMHINMSRIKWLKTDAPTGIMQPRQHQLAQSVHTAAAPVPLVWSLWPSTLLVLLTFLAA